MLLIEFKKAVLEAKQFAEAGDVNSAIFDIAAALSCLAEAMEREFNEINERLEIIRRAQR